MYSKDGNLGTTDVGVVDINKDSKQGTSWTEGGCS